MNKNLNVLLIARGSSHIKLYKELQQNVDLKICVIKCRFPSLPSLKYLKQTEALNMEEILALDFAKQATRHPILSKSVIGRSYKVIRIFLERCFISRYAKIIDEIKPDLVGAWNGQKQPGRSLIESAKLNGAKVVYFENGLLPNTITVDLKGVNALNSLSSNPEIYQQYGVSNRKKIPLPVKLTSPKRAHSNSASKQIKLPKRFIFVPFQMAIDSQVLNLSPRVNTMFKLYDELVKCTESSSVDKDICFIVKQHPKCKMDYSRLHKNNKRIIFADYNDTQELIENAEAVVTLNSTVGIESLMLNKKVITLGMACYNIQGIVEHATTTKELIELISNVKLLKVDSELRKDFVTYVYNEYCIDRQDKHRGYKQFHLRLHGKDYHAENANFEYNS